MKLALGTAQFGLDYGVTNQYGQVAVGEIKRILSYATYIGIDTLDTASGYGKSEEVLGEIGINEYQIITKTTPIKNGVNEAIKCFYLSLDRLNIDQVEGLLIHNFDDVMDKRFIGLYKKLNQLKEEGVLKKIGFSTYSPEQVDFLLKNFDFDMIQVPFNVFDIRLASGGQLKALKMKNIEIHARSVFLQGVLLSFDKLSDYFSTWHMQFERYQAMVKDRELSLLEYALNFALNTQELDKVLVGICSENQLREIACAAKKQINIEAYPIDDLKLLNPSNWSL